MSQHTAMASRTSEDTILSVEDLTTAFFTDKETIYAVDGASFDLRRGETIGIVGESGSGKSVTARSVMGLVESPGRILDGSSIKYRNPETVERLADQFSGEVTYRDGDGEPEGDGCIVLDDGEGTTRGYVDLARAPQKVVKRIRGGDIAMIFQDPLSSLNPVYTVGNQIKEALNLHRDLGGRNVTDEAAELLEAVGIPDARMALKEYPHQFSGGQRQRIVIAMALACDPEVLICDEPTTALDVTIQAQILDLLDDLQRERDLGIVFITHDMGVISEISDRVNVMYAGEIVETAPAETLFTDPAHPYTRGLLESIPGRNPGADRLTTIEGDVPTPNQPATDCRFAPRCPEQFDACTQVHPESVSVTESATDHTTACLLYPDDRSREDAVALHEHRGRGETDDEPVRTEAQR
ncbi:ABC transporter ATP-binding protein [Halococcus saccharolyticus]|uniref:Nickel import system ATP-binding protein NikD n=1 Tax=Halococcus saccharolyticus DSM 5350 TaxID=1227455 RepID=M0MBK6_9EURY|nr:ABC transporter ATP-binding protein [Halococcus saccharolyticus]EMA42733.1 oligopeptide ABC transporter ATPase [Halococcus saccharolyticus DSM 5350]